MPNGGNVRTKITTAYPWCDGHFTSISACGVWGTKAGIQVSKRKLYTHIQLDYARIKILSCIKKKIYIYIYIYNFNILYSHFVSNKQALQI